MAPMGEKEAGGRVLVAALLCSLLAQRVFAEPTSVEVRACMLPARGVSVWGRNTTCFWAQAQFVRDAVFETLPLTRSGVCDAGVLRLNTQGHHFLGHE